MYSGDLTQHLRQTQQESSVLISLSSNQHSESALTLVALHFFIGLPTAYLNSHTFSNEDFGVGFSAGHHLVLLRTDCSNVGTFDRKILLSLFKGYH